MRKRIRWACVRTLAFVSTQYFLIATGTAGVTVWIASTTSDVIAAKLESTTNALHKLH